MTTPTLTPTSRWADWRRYPRLYGQFMKFCLIREMSFRFNFILRLVTEVFWLVVIIFFFQLIFGSTKQIGDWDKHRYLFFMGTAFIINGIVETFFMDNCSNISDLIRKGDLDFALLKPIDEQFLLTTQRVDWACLGTVLIGLGEIVWSIRATPIEVTPLRTVAYLSMIACGVALMYSFMLLMASTSVWIVRNKGLYEFWFYVTQFARYPAEIYDGNWIGKGLNLLLTYILPILIAVNTPARVGARLITEPATIAYFVVAAGVALIASRWFFQYALRAYRSASS